MYQKVVVLWENVVESSFVMSTRYEDIPDMKSAQVSAG